MLKLEFPFLASFNVDPAAFRRLCVETKKAFGLYKSAASRLQAAVC